MGSYRKKYSESIEFSGFIHKIIVYPFSITHMYRHNSLKYTKIVLYP